MFPIRRIGTLVAAMAIVLCAPTDGHAQILKKLKKTVKQAAEEEALSRVDRLVRDGVACPFNDFSCIRDAKKSEDEYYLTDADGKIIVDKDNEPVTDPDRAAEILANRPASAGGAVPPPPGAGAVPPADLSTARSNYDFEPGDRVILDEDFSVDNVGDFPRRFELVEGSFEVIEWQERRYLRALSGGMFAVPLPETLPERFTIETAINLQHGNAYVRLMPGRAFVGRPQDYRGSAVSVELTQAGVRPAGAGPTAMAPVDVSLTRDAVTPLRVMADGDHMKVYLGDERVANVPNAVLPRSDTLFFAVTAASSEMPVIVGPIRVAAGGRDLYDRLATEGRVATRDIHFDVNSATIRAESGDALEEIGTMLREHPDLRIRIEGHTDSDGDEAANLALSERRAASVKEWLVKRFQVDADRLETEGFGETKPVSDNDTPVGKQLNRRVELVRLDAPSGHTHEEAP